ncbi:esterase E4 isoform X1 [Manduca sexta]|uniref:Esterase n=1 Tax=Manduca sexta TaxID=7130 RepID=A0A921ZAZ9_MANSE|nr:esterase E4 isoform X1 [Manduca sexta]KAG6454576.1 hypothetical protein O3G_MSEX008769 [Manduca sexta]KAG6454577.1 hypothetical protein O3G_MSEX008769 [Manduca sexta]UXP71958.1 esterase [Manduca sexta]
MITAVNEFLDDLRGGRMTEAPVVNVEQGRLQGRVVNSPSGRAFYSFQGIPYAKPPLGSLRFKAPQPPEPWEGIRDATSEGNVSAQIDYTFTKEYTGDENCLFLNIYTPNLDGEFLPVLFWVHGGGYRWGSGNSNLYGPDYLVEKDVVVVTINYRCGPLGFLCLNTPEVSGNAGFKDQIQALRWVKENIHNFGGNSGNITVFGESFGAISTSILTASPLSKNLMSKAIMQSGCGLCQCFQEDPIKNAKTLASHLGCDADDVDEILEFLNSTPTRDLVEANEKINPLDSSPMLFTLVIEKEFPGIEAAISEAFIDILTSGRVANVPVMIGGTTLELCIEKKSDDLQDFIPADLKLERNSEESLAIAEKIKEIYFKGKPKNAETMLEQFQLFSDQAFNIDMHRYIKYLVQATNKPIYFYKFDYVGELNVSLPLFNQIGMKCATHMAELGYLFKNDFQKDVEPTPQDVKTRERVVRLWTNFAKSGNPTPDENHYLTTTWLPVTKDTQYYLNIGSELSLGTNPDKEKMDFWDEVYTKYFKIWDHPKTNTLEAPRKTEPEIISVIETVVTSQVIEESSVPKTPEPSPEIVDSPPEIPEPIPAVPEPEPVIPEPVAEIPEPAAEIPAPAAEIPAPAAKIPEPAVISEHKQDTHVNGIHSKPRTSNEIKMVQNSNGMPKDVIRANDPPEDDLPKNIGVNKFVNFFESLGGKK